LSLMEHVCDMLVRIQAAGTAVKFQRLVSMVPRALSPFQFSSQDALKPMVDSEGCVRSVFNVPRPLDLLALRGTAAVAFFDVVASSLRTAAQVDTVLGKSAKEPLSLPQMEVCYTGPSYVTLCMLHHMAPLVSSFFFWTALAAEKWMPLHLHQAVLGVRWQDAAQMDAVASVLSEEMLGEVDMDEVDLEHRKGGVHKAWDALQVMRVEFSSLAGQLRGLKDNSPDTVIGFLKAKLQSAAWRTSLLLRQASRDALQQDRLHDFAEVQTWSKYLDGHPLNRNTSAVSLVAGLTEEDSDELMQGLSNQTLERQLGTEAHSTGLRCVQSPLNHQPLSEYQGWLAPLSRPCRYLNVFLHVLLATTQSALAGSGTSRPASPVKPMDSSQTMTVSIAPPAKLTSLMPSRFPGLPLEALPRALCLLPATSREQVANFALKLEMKVEDWKVFTGAVDQDTSLSAETELVRGKLVAIRLNEVATCAQLGVFPPRTSQELHALEQVTEVPSSLRIELADDHGARIAGPLSDTEEAEEQRLRGIVISQELRAENSLIALLEVELAKVLATFAASAFEKQLAEVEEFRSPGSHSSTVGPAGIRGMYSHPTSPTRKLEAVVALNRLRTRGTRCRTHGLGEPNLYVIRERDVDDCVEELGRQLLQWLFVSTDSQLWDMSTAVAATASEVKRLEQGALQNAHEAKLRSDRFSAEVASNIAFRSSADLFEVDRLNRVLCEMAATGMEMEHRLNAQVRATLLAEMEGLEQQGNAAEGRFKEYIAEMRDLVQKQTIPSAEVKAFQEELQTDIRQRLKDDASAAQAAASAASPVSAGHSAGAGKEVEQSFSLKAPVTVVSSTAVSAPEDEFAPLHAERAALQKAEVRLQTLCKLRHQRLRSEQEQELKELTVFLSSNAGLWEHVSEVREREHLTKEQLASSQRRKQQAHATIDMHSQHKAQEEETNERLESWKGAAFECHRGLLAESQKYETQSSLDKDLLQHELAKVDQEIQQFNRGNILNIRVGLEKERSKKEQQHHRQRAKAEERLAKKAMAQADVLQRELDCGDADAESLIGLCVEEYRETLQKVLALEAENAAMKVVMAEEATSKNRRHAIKGHHLIRKDVDMAKQKALAQATDLEEICFSMGGTQTSMPKFRNKIDQTHGGKVDLTSLTTRPSFNFNGGPPAGSGSRSARNKRDASPLASLAATARQLSARGSPPGTSGASRPPGGSSGTARLELPPGSAGGMSRREKLPDDARMKVAIASELLNMQPSASGATSARS